MLPACTADGPALCHTGCGASYCTIKSINFVGHCPKRTPTAPEIWHETDTEFPIMYFLKVVL